MKINSKIFLIFSFTVLVFVIFGGWFLFNRISVLDKSIGETNISILNFTNDIKNLKSMESFLRESSEERKVLERAFVSEDGLVKFIEDLEENGKESGVDVEVNLATVSQDQSDSPSFRIESRGSFSSVYKYLTSLENLPYEISINRTSLDSEGEGKWRGIYEIKLLSYEN